MTGQELYTVQYDPKAAKELGKLDKQTARRVAKVVEKLRTDRRRPGGRSLVGHPGLWRVRIGDHRVVYTIKDAELVVLALRIAHRGDVYR